MGISWKYITNRFKVIEMIKEEEFESLYYLAVKMANKGIPITKTVRRYLVTKRRRSCITHTLPTQAAILTSLIIEQRKYDEQRTTTNP